MVEVDAVVVVVVVIETQPVQIVAWNLVSHQQ
jgi:hypothetical protein